MAASLDTPKVFISYSWRPVTHKQKTIELAKRLSNDGVHVIIDEWDLKEGQDKYQFMEQMVNDPEIKRALLICNKDYTEKANAKKGGVGVESLIISDEIYSKAEQKKFIPIVFERNEDGHAYLPTFIKTRIYIDLSDEDNFEDEYEKLLRNIFESPASRRPVIGTRPSYLDENQIVFLKTAHKVKAIENALIKEKKNVQALIDDYYSAFINAFNDFEISDDDFSKCQDIDEIVIKKIDDLLPLRDDFINFIDVLLTYPADFNQDRFVLFLENLIKYMAHNEANSYSYNFKGYSKIDHYRFFYYELFLYLAAAMIEKGLYKELGSILHNPFIIINEKEHKTEQRNFTIFNQYISSFDQRNKRLQLRRVSIAADLLKKRSTHSKYTFDKLKECDAILYYISLMLPQNTSISWSHWFPHITTYEMRYSPIIERFISQSFFEKVKYLFAVDSIVDFKEKVTKTSKLNIDRVDRMYYGFPYLQNVFNFDTIGTLK